jgi:uridine kinase
MAASEADHAITKRAHYSPPWADVSIIGVAGSSGSGKSTLSRAIVKRLNLPWVVILSIVSAKAIYISGEPVSQHWTGFFLQEP